MARRADAAARALAPRADDDALQPQRRATPLLLVDDGRRCAPTTTRASSTRWSSRRPTTSPTWTPGRSTPRASTSAGRATTSRASSRASATAAASPSWASTIRATESGVVHVADHRGHARQEDLVLGLGRRGPGLAPRALGRRERLPRGPGRASSATRRPTPSSSREQVLRFRESYQPVRKIGGWLAGQRRRASCTCGARRRARCASGSISRESLRGGRIVVRDGATSVRAEPLSPHAGRSVRSRASPISRPRARTPSRSATRRAACCSRTPRTATTSCSRSDVKTGPQPRLTCFRRRSGGARATGWSSAATRS